MLYSFEIVILHKAALLKILVSHEYLHSGIALYVELLFILCLCSQLGGSTLTTATYLHVATRWLNPYNSHLLAQQPPTCTSQLGGSTPTTATYL
jgi:hypothetical protein